MAGAINNLEAAGWLVYFNGIEVPATSATVSARVGDIPTATVVLPPDYTMRRIGALDKVRATIFYYDSFYTVSKGQEPDWRLLFDGEIVEWSYTNSATGRQLQYTAVDMIAVLTQIFPMFISNVSSLVSSETQTSSSGVSAAVNPVAVTHYLFNVGLASGEIIRRPYEFVENVFRLMLGEGMDDNLQSVVTSHWFKRWVERTEMLRRIMPSYDVPEGEVPYPHLTAGFPILEAAQDEKIIATLSAEGDRIANSSSYYEVIQTLFQRMYYDLNPILAPPCVAADEKTHFVKGPSAAAAQAGLITLIGQHVTQPKNFFGVPPKCNVFWPSMVEQHAFSENFATQPTRTYLGNTYLLEAVGKGTTDPNVMKLVDTATTEAYPEEARRLLEMKKQNAANINIANFLVYPEEFFRGPVYNRMESSTWFSFLNGSTTPENIKRVHRLYTAMEHHRTRLSRRNGAVSMVFNPYVVGGQPCVTLDEVSSNLHTFGYVMGVQHSLGQDAMSTSVQYTYAQTFDEFFETLLVQRAEYGMIGVEREFVGPTQQEVVDFAPIHPIQELRTKFQVTGYAGEYYNNILWGETESAGDVVFDWSQVVGVQNQQGELERIRLTLEDSNAIPREDGHVPVFDILPRYAAFAKDTRKALEYVSRPVCTMDEYVQFHGDYGTREGLRHPSNTAEGKMAPYYVKILNFKQGPGTEPGQMVDGNRCSAVDVDTVRNWEARLLRFRQKVYHERRPHLS